MYDFYIQIHANEKNQAFLRNMIKQILMFLFLMCRLGLLDPFLKYFRRAPELNDL